MAFDFLYTKPIADDSAPAPHLRLFNEPVLLAAAIRTVAAAVILFQSWSLEEKVAAGAAVESVIALITRSLVTPNKLAEARVAAGGSPTTPQSDPPVVP